MGSLGSIPPNVGLAICALIGRERPDLSAAEVIRRLEAPATGVLEVPKAYSITEAGRILGVSRRKAYSLIHEGKLPMVTLGHRTKRIPHAALAALLAAPAPVEA
jgi:excisionase family DNA binding protein